jgi:hypothetical protein
MTTRRIVGTVARMWPFPVKSIRGERPAEAGLLHSPAFSCILLH